MNPLLVIAIKVRRRRKSLVLRFPPLWQHVLLLSTILNFGVKNIFQYCEMPTGGINKLGWSRSLHKSEKLRSRALYEGDSKMAQMQRPAFHRCCSCICLKVRRRLGERGMGGYRALQLCSFWKSVGFSTKLCL